MAEAKYNEDSIKSLDWKEPFSFSLNGLVLRVLVFFCLVLFSDLALGQSLSLDEIISKHIEVMGGYDSINNIKTVKYYGKEYSFLSGTKKEVDSFLVQLKVGKAFRNDSKSIPTMDIQVVTDTLAWYRESKSKKYYFDKDLRDDFDEVKTINVFAPLANYKKYGYGIEYVGLDSTIFGKKVYVLSIYKLNNPTQLIETYYLDSKTFMILGYEIIGREFKAIKQFDDYKKINGVYFPFCVYIGNKAKKEYYLMTKYQKIEVNKNIPDSLFLCPKCN